MMVDVAATAVVANGVVLIAATPVWGLISRASAGPREAGRANRITGQHKHAISPEEFIPRQPVVLSPVTSLPAAVGDRAAAGGAAAVWVALPRVP